LAPRTAFSKLGDEVIAALPVKDSIYLMPGDAETEYNMKQLPYARIIASRRTAKLA
jgi:hypothetical protein